MKRYINMGNKLAKLREQSKKLDEVKKQSKLKGLYLTPHAIMGYHNITHFVILGARGRGKSVLTLDAPIAAKRKYGYENVKIYYFRLSDLSIKAMLANKAAKAIDPILMHKYDLELSTKGNIVYDHGKELMTFYPLVSAGKVGKGVCEYDYDFLNKRPIDPKTGKPVKRFVFFILDEFLMADGIEKKTVGDPVDQYLIYMEALLRDQKRLDYDAVRCFYLANMVSECASFTGRLFNFIPHPGDFGIKKLTRQHTLVWNVPNTDEYYEKRKNSYTSDLIKYDEDPNYTNVVQRDLSTIKDKKTRLHRVTNIIMFSKLETDWFAVYDGKYIRRYSKETVKDEIKICMYRHQNAIYIPELVLNVFERYDSKDFMYADIISQASFSAQMKKLKAK